MQLIVKGIVGKNYIIDTNVDTSAKIDVQLSNVPPDRVLKLLTGIIQKHGYDMKDQDGFIVFSKIPQITETQNTDLINKLQSFEKPLNTDLTQTNLLSPVTFNLPEKIVDTDFKKYTPQFVEPEYLDKLLKFSGAQSEIINGALIYRVAADRQDFIQNLLRDFDIKRPDLVIKATLYEVSKSKTHQNAVAAALKIISGAITATIPSIDISGATKISLSTSDLAASISALNSNEDFKVISSPSIRAMHDKPALINIGASVPVLNQIVTNANGQAQQSIQYRDSGITLEVTPKIRTENIELKILQTVSDFQQTTTGVNQSPTLIQRKLDTTLNCSDNDLIFLGGLDTLRSENGANRLFGIPLFKRHKSENTDLLLVLHVKKT